MTPREALEAKIEQAISLLDALDGDSDHEPNTGDEEPSHGADDPELDTADSEPTEDDEDDYRRHSAA
jgi:hypothetical protein